MSTFTGTEFMSAAAKAKVAKQWKLFVKSGFARAKFTRALYQHLLLHCGFIAHYDIDGFFAARFATPSGRAVTLKQLYGEGLGYRHTASYADINLAIASEFDLDACLADCWEQRRRSVMDEILARAAYLRLEFGMKVDVIFDSEEEV